MRRTQATLPTPRPRGSPMARGKARRSLELIEASIEILREIQPATVRAVAYRLFTRGLIGNMSKTETNKVSRQLTDAREAGWIPWAWLVDETRRVEAAPAWTDPAAFANAVTRSYRRNKWTAQPWRVEVWSEKGTQRGTLAPVLDAFEVPFRVMHGFASATTVQDIASASLTSAQPLVALYAGDWDPSGLYMSEEDLPGRLDSYRANIYEQRAGAGWDEGRLRETGITIKRLALTAEDVQDPALPSFALETKRNDTRHDWYLAAGYGRRCWELDALSPVVLRDRIKVQIVATLDRATWDRYVAAEELELESITRAVQSWGALSEVR
jgi:hypothetical protein